MRAMKTPLPRSFAALALLLAGAAAAPAVAAAPSPPATPAAPAAGSPAAAAAQAPAHGGDDFVDTVTVNVVNVDVYVTDKKTGNRITGLTKNDFELREDGKPMAITNFYAVEGGRATGLAAEAQASPAAPGEPRRPATDHLPLPEDQRLRLVIYIDNFNIRPFDRNRVMRELRVFLDTKLHRDDQVMLVSYDRSLKVRHGFTSDPTLINAAMTELEKHTGEAIHLDSERRQVLEQIEQAGSAAEAYGQARGYAGSVFNDLEFSIDSLKNLVSSLAGMPGRKAILYVSDGLPMIAGEDVFYAVQNKFKGETSSGLAEMMQYDSSRRFQELTAQANANRVTFYAIDAGGLRVYSSNSAENATAGQGVYIDQIDQSNYQSSIQMIAEKTGGVAVLNANTVGKHLDRIAEDFSSYYSLGYMPTHLGDGRFHKVEVKVRKGLVARYREGYRDKSAEARMSDGTLAALSFQFESNPIGAALEFGRVLPRSDGFFIVPVNVRIPLGKVLLVPHNEAQEARVRVFVAAMDSQGGTSDVQQQSVPIRVPLADVPKIGSKYFVYTLNLLMRGGDQRVAVGVRDDLAGQESFITGGLRPGA
jgi:VWFA-related protein